MDGYKKADGGEAMDGYMKTDGGEAMNGYRSNSSDGAIAPTELPVPVQEYGYADTLILNGKVVSMDDPSTTPNPGHIYQAMAIKRDKIIALGENEEIRKLAGPKTSILDMKGRTVIPGLIECHAHLHDYATVHLAGEVGLKEPEPGIGIEIEAAGTLDDTWKLVEEAIIKTLPQLKPEDWLLVSVRANREAGITSATLLAWSQRKRLTSRKQLDQLAPTQLVLVQFKVHAFALGGFFNSRACEEANKLLPGYWEFSDQAWNPAATEAGWVGFGELAALRWQIWYAKKPLAQIAEMLRRESENWAAFGVTTFATRIPMPIVISAYNLLDRTNQMPIRLAAHYETHRMPAPPETFHSYYHRTGVMTGMGNDYFWFTGVASELWDHHGLGACLGPDVEAPPEVKARQRTPKQGDFFWVVLKEALKAGWRLVGIHGVGSHGARLFLQMVEEGMAEQGLTVEDVRKLRMSLEHCVVIGNQPDVTEKLIQYGMFLSFSTYFIEDSQQYLDVYGPKIESFILPVKTLIEAGVKAVGNMDTHLPYDLGAFHFLWILIARKVGDRVIVPEEKLDRGIVLKMWTRWAADYVAREEVIGSLEVGKFADFIVLDRDYFTIPEDDIRGIKPLMTVVGGKVVSLKQEFARELKQEPVGYQPPPDWPTVLIPRFTVKG